MPDNNSINTKDIDTLATRLKWIAQGRQFLDVAQFQFIGLDEIKDAYGERWPEHRERAQVVASDFLRRRVDANDLLISVGNGFVVVFSNAAGHEAEVAAGRLSHALNEFFVGESGVSHPLRVSATTGAVRTTALAATFGDLEVLSQNAPEPATASFDFGKIEWRFQPSWVVKRETLSSWYVAPYLLSTKERVPGYLFESDSPSSAQFVDVDEASIRAAERAIGDLMREGKQALVGMSVHATTLANLPSRNRILSLLDHLPEGLARYRILKIAGIAPGFPRLYLREIVAALRSRVPNVVLGASWREPDMASLTQCGVVAVGMYLSPSVTSGTDAAALTAAMQRVTTGLQAARAAHIQFAVEGRIAPDFAMRLAGMGVDVITSPVIWPPRSAPDSMLKWPAANLAT